MSPVLPRSGEIRDRPENLAMNPDFDAERQREADAAVSALHGESAPTSTTPSGSLRQAGQVT